jgi:hypothetical protein
MMQYREPINVSDIVSELRRLWVLPVAGALAFALLFLALQLRSETSFEQRVDVVGADASGFAAALGAPNVIEPFDADVVAKREQSKLDVLNQESPRSEKVRVQGSPQTHTVSIFGSATSSAAALDLATAYANQVVDTQRAEATERFAATRGVLETDLTRIQAAIDAKANNDDSERVLLLVDRASTVKLLAVLSAIEIGSGGGVRDPEVIGTPAEISTSSLGTYTVLGALLGLVLGAGFIVLRRTLSSAVYGAGDLSRYGSTVPVLADVTGSDSAGRGVFAALASACAQAASPGRVLGVLFAGVGPHTVPSNLPAGVLEALPALGLEGSTTSPEDLTTLDPTADHGEFHVVVVDDGIRESSSAIACAGRVASTVVVLRRRKTSIASALEAIDLVHQADGQLRGIVIVD